MAVYKDGMEKATPSGHLSCCVGQWKEVTTSASRWLPKAKFSRIGLLIRMTL